VLGVAMNAQKSFRIGVSDLPQKEMLSLERREVAHGVV
jgi:hypothetical protein